MQDWAEIRRLRFSEEVPIAEIARRLGIARNTVKAALAADAPPRYERARKGSVVDAVEPAIRELLKDHPRMPSTVIAERIGWSYGLTVLKERVRELRPVYLPPDPASRTAYVPGEIAQFDFWFPPITLDVGAGQARTAKQLPVLTMVCGYSRWREAILIPSRTEEDLYAGWWTLLSSFGAVPRVLVWDNEGAVGRWGPAASALTAAAQAFRGVLGTKVYVCRPADPEAKGMLERTHDHYERSFLPGRSFTGPQDFNTQLAAWRDTSNQRHVRVLGCRPIDRVAADKTAMLPLPPVPPLTGWHRSTRLPRDYYVRLDSNDYSVHPCVIGQRIELRADLSRVQVTSGGKLVADHPRSWAMHQTFTDPAHAQAAVALRRARSITTATATATASMTQQEATGHFVEQRDLSVYDHLSPGLPQGQSQGQSQGAC